MSEKQPPRHEHLMATGPTIGPASFEQFQALPADLQQTIINDVTARASILEALLARQYRVPVSDVTVTPPLIPADALLEKKDIFLNGVYQFTNYAALVHYPFTIKGRNTQGLLHQNMMNWQYVHTRH
jgi:hypothetical protein